MSDEKQGPKTARQRRQAAEPSRRSRKVKRRETFMKTRADIARAKVARRERRLAHQKLVQDLAAKRVLRQQAREQAASGEAAKLGIPTIETPSTNGSGHPGVEVK